MLWPSRIWILDSLAVQKNAIERLWIIGIGLNDNIMNCWFMGIEIL